jgi:RNA polymerase sigma-70 factor (ECF subfamily)
MAIARITALPPLPGLVAAGLPFARTATPRVTFAELVRDHQDEVFGLALRMLGDRDAAMDVTSTVFLKAYRAFDRYDHARPARNWLLRITVNESISAGRATTRELARRASADAALDVPGREGTPEDEAIRREDRERIRGAVAALPELYRTPVVLRYFSGLSLEEIAQVTGRSASTVGVQLLRARAMLRAALGSPARPGESAT